MATPTPVIGHLAGRDLHLKMVTDAQFTMVGVLGKRAMDEGLPAEARMKAVGSLQQIFLSMIIDDDDREWVEEQIIQGKIDLGDLTTLTESFKTNAPKTKVTRGRAGKK